MQFASAQRLGPVLEHGVPRSSYSAASPAAASSVPSPHSSLVYSSYDSQPVLATDTSPDAQRRKEAELEAERLWWSEASERQVKDLESAFGVQFQHSSERLRSEIVTCQDRLEILVEAERQQRHAAIASIKRDLDEVARSQPDLRSMEQRLEAGLRGLSGLVSDTCNRQSSGDAESSAMRGILEDAQFAVEWEQQKASVQSLQAGIVELRREMQLQKAQMDRTLGDMRLDLDGVREVAQGRDVDAVVGSAEKRIGLRIEETFGKLEAANQKLCTELAQVLSESCCELARNFELIREEFDALRKNVSVGNHSARPSVASQHSEGETRGLCRLGGTGKAMAPVTLNDRSPTKSLIARPTLTLDTNAGVDTPAAQDGFLRALQAVNELREHNISLREQNNELMEELLAGDGAVSPSGSCQGLQWTPSVQQSTCNSPRTEQHHQAAQVSAGSAVILVGTEATKLAVRREPLTMAEGWPVTSTRILSDTSCAQASRPSPKSDAYPPG